MAETEIYVRLGVALAIGLGVGLERGWKQRSEPSGKRETGIRTFAILALIGFAVGIGLDRFGPLFAGAAALGVIAIIAIGYATESVDVRGDRGATTEVAAFLTFILGALAGVGELLAAGLTAAILVGLLDYKEELHGLLARMQHFELTAAVKLALVAVVLLPVLPNEGYGPGGVLNPHELWFAVVAIAALGLAGYAAMKAGGAQRGALFMGLMGGLLSSTAVTVSASRASNAAPSGSVPLASAIATAQAVMFIRTGVLISVLNIALLDQVVLALALGAITSIVGALLLSRRTVLDRADDVLAPGSPDTLGAAMQFVLFVAVALIASHYAQLYLGDAGLLVSGLLAGGVDVDAATVSATRLSGGALHAVSERAAAGSIGMALIANSFVKSGIAYALGSRDLAWPAIAVLLASSAAVLLGLAAGFLLPG